MNDKFQDSFIVEARELLEELQSALLELEADPDNMDIIGRIFRAMHTIKGSGAMFGFSSIASLTHDIENFYDLVRNGKIGITKPIIDLTLHACDQIAAMVQLSNTSNAEEEEIAQKIAGAFREFAGTAEGIKPKEASSPEVNNDPIKERVYRIRFQPETCLFANGTNPIPLFEELSTMGNCRVTAQTDAIPMLQELQPEECMISWEILLTTSLSMDAIRDVFIFVENACNLSIDEVSVPECSDCENAPKKLGEVLVSRGDISSEDLDAVLKKHQRIGDDIVMAGLAQPDTIRAARAEQQHLEDLRQKHRESGRLDSIRVPAGKLDDLVNMVGELVTVQSRLHQRSAFLQDPELLQISEEVERLISDLRENAMSIRMLPIGTMFNKFSRLVRDLSQELGKDIALLTEGAETELDKTVIERLNDPLIHLIRNAVDHGIEPPELRERANKSVRGTIRLSAEHSGAHVLIRILDDGAGLNRERIRAKAVERGIVSADAVLTDRELFALVLQPGFSTARAVSNISGRGVGMDVVKKSIEAMQGTIDIQSENGRGTVITLRLPLTLAIIDGLLVQVGRQTFVLPLSAVEECVELSGNEMAQTSGQRMINIRNAVIPYIRLRNQFGITEDLAGREQIVIANAEGSRLGLMVDQVIGEYQTVIKNLGRMYRDVEEISGATILGDGSIALILDLPKLFRKVEKEESGIGCPDMAAATMNHSLEPPPTANIG